MPFESSIMGATSESERPNFLGAGALPHLNFRVGPLMSENQHPSPPTLNFRSKAPACRPVLDFTGSPYCTCMCAQVEESPKKKGKRWIPVREKVQDEQDVQPLRTLSQETFEERRQKLQLQLRKYGDDGIVITQRAKSESIRRKKNKKKFLRASQYRGVSRNKRKWQVMIMGNYKKMYFGQLPSELDAARQYDKIAILSHGVLVSK